MTPAGTQIKSAVPAERYFEPSPRIQRIRQTLLSTPYSICLERPLLLLQHASAKEGRKYRNSHPFERRAAALRHLMGTRKPHIYDDELIIGNMTSKRIAANYFFEGGSINILEDLFRLKSRQIPLVLNFSEKASLLRIAASTMLSSIGARALLRPGRFRHFIDFFRAKRYFITEEAGIGHQVGGYWNVVHHGLRMQEDIAAKCLDSGTLPDGTPLNEDNRAFYKSVRITIEGIVKMAANLAEEAERLAMLPDTPPERRIELMESASACRHVPYNPARSFLEGLQSCWLVHIALNLEDFEQGMSFGRLDRILYLLFEKDIKEGRITMERAVELMASFQLKTCETMPIYSERIDKYFSGNGVAQGITIGGTDETGKDTTNVLSGVVLDAFAQIRTREPAIHVRVHGLSPSWFLEKAVEVVQLGAGKPSFFGDDAIVRALQGAGISREHARD
jgi:pyruvate-formate lyase